MTAPSEALASVAMVAPVLLGIAVLTAQAIIAGARDRLRDDAVNLALTVTGWSLIAVGILGSFLTLIAVVWIPWWIVAFVVMIETVHKYHKSQQYALLWLLAASAEKSMPLVPAIEAFARERGGHFGRRTKRVAELLKSGLSLPDALARCGDVLPPRAVSIIRMGCESGSLPSALQDAVTTVGHYRSVWTSVAGKLIYVIAMLCYGAGILSFVMCCIAPKFGKMFKEFGVVLPGPCRLLISVSDFAVNYWYLSGPFWLALTVFVFHATLRHYGWIQWDLPGIGWFLRRLDAANLMDSLAIVARQERPLLDGITGLARSYPRPSIRRRLARAADDIAAGADWAESLRRCGLIGRADLAILQAAQRAGNLSWALREMAQSSRRRFSYRLQAIAQTAFPAIVVLFGAMVAFIVVALFLPLITLIQAAATN